MQRRKPRCVGEAAPAEALYREPIGTPIGATTIRPPSVVVSTEVDISQRPFADVPVQ